MPVKQMGKVKAAESFFSSNPIETTNLIIFAMVSIHHKINTFEEAVTFHCSSVPSRCPLCPSGLPGSDQFEYL
jgi:hypothetical protein